jgi:hypothetical protein
MRFPLYQEVFSKIVAGRANPLPEAAFPMSVQKNVYPVDAIFARGVNEKGRMASSA